ncbi:hypothetical protein, partial [Klebsiella pneumoniae]|uniref:hypothetical protein n=1 Tax=Klebsiella pneumoniae TaxID=573 RepID=UPI0021A47F14
KWPNCCHGTWFLPINNRQYGAHLTLTYNVQWLAQLALLVVVRVAVNPHQKRLWVHGPKLIHTMLPVVWR